MRRRHGGIVAAAGQPAAAPGRPGGRARRLRPRAPSGAQGALRADRALLHRDASAAPHAASVH